MATRAEPKDSRSGKNQAVSMPPRTVAKFFRGLGDQNRIRILQLILEKERSVGELVDLIKAPQGRVSNHLTCLRWCGFVTTRKEGRQVFYQVADKRVRSIIGLAQSILSETAVRVETCRIIDPPPRPLATKAGFRLGGRRGGHGPRKGRANEPF